MTAIRPSPTVSATPSTAAPEAPRAETPAPAAAPAPDQFSAAQAPSLGPVVPVPMRERVLDRGTPEADALVAKSLEYLCAAKSKWNAVGGGFVPRQIYVDARGQSHVRMDLNLPGVNLAGEQVIVHLDANGALIDITGSAVPSQLAPSATTAPRVSADAAKRAAEAAFRADSGGLESTDTSDPQLTFIRGKDDLIHKAYVVTAQNFDASTPYRNTYYVDALTSELVSNQVNTRFTSPNADNQRRSLVAAKAPAESEGTGTSRYSGSVPLGTHRREDGKYVLMDDSRGGSWTRDAQDQTRYVTAVDVEDDDNAWGEPSDSPRQTDALDAHYGMAMTWDFYKNVLGRNSIDGKGMPINSVVHRWKSDGPFAEPHPVAEAYWNNDVMVYGDGDGTMWGPMTAVDIAGHELSHGFTTKACGLEVTGEAGGVYEAMGDIFGIGVRWYASVQNPTVKFSWRHGEQGYTPDTPGDAFRYMNDPTRDGYSIDHMRDLARLTGASWDNGGVHATNGIANNAFYLMVEGGTNHTSGLSVAQGIGMQPALQIMYRAVTAYFTPRTGFRDVAAAAVRSAKELFGEGSKEHAATIAAWTAVGAL